MKKTTKHLSIFLIGFIVMFQVVVAQSGKNPFSVKQKNNTTKVLTNPSKPFTDGIFTICGSTI